MNFGEAVEALKKGGVVCRSGWNGKGMFLLYVEYSNSVEAEERPHCHYHNIKVEGLPWIGMKTADDKFVPCLASQTDILAEDWMLLDEKKTSKALFDD